MSQRGNLIIAANAIGNPQDIPQRALDAVRDCDIVLFEEDRPARLVLKTAGIHREYWKLNEHTGADTLDSVRKALKKSRSVCYMSDQGMANLADPGHQLLEIAFQLDCKVEVIPGPSSVTAAISACPFPVKQFSFFGFLSRHETERVKELKTIKNSSQATVLLEAPYRRGVFLEQMSEFIGKDRKALMALDISGPQETYLYGTIDCLQKKNQTLKEKLNFVFVLQPNAKRPSYQKRNRGDRR